MCKSSVNRINRYQVQQNFINLSEHINEKIKAIWMKIRLNLFKIYLLVCSPWVSKKSRKFYYALVLENSHYINAAGNSYKKILLTLKFCKYKESEKTISIRQIILFKACENGFLDIVKKLLTDPKFDPNTKMGHSYLLKTPLEVACFFNKLEIVKELLKSPNINVNQQSSHSTFLLNCCSPLYIACGAARSLEIVKELLKHPKINPNKGFFSNDDSFSPLYLACKRGCLETVKELLKHPKIDISQIANKFVGELQIAYKKGHIEIVQLLLKSLHSNTLKNGFFHLSNLIELIKKSHKHKYEHLKILAKLLKYPKIDLENISPSIFFDSHLSCFYELLKSNQINNEMQTTPLLKEILIIIIAKAKIFLELEKETNKILLEYALEESMKYHDKTLKDLTTQAAKLLVNFTDIELPKDPKYKEQIKKLSDKVQVNSPFQDVTITCY